MVRKIIIGIMVLVFLVGLGFFLYPYAQGALIDREIKDTAEDFHSRVEVQPTTDNGNTVIIDTTKPTEEILYPTLWTEMWTYNETIYTEGQSGLSCAYDYQKPSFTLKDYGLEDEVFGVISIPAMELNMPIFLGATEKHMADGAAHMSQTSLPIGGNNTNCVIAGHRGYGGASYFRYIEKLRVGDSVSITNLWETLEYRVVQIKIIYPYEVEEILIQENRDLLTLLTCHPYASGGKQRYLVICERNN
jgi:sortase A